MPKLEESTVLVLGDISYVEPFSKEGALWEIQTVYGSIDWVAAEAKMNKCNLVCFTGGEDIDPSVYDEDQHPLCGDSTPIRDLNEIKLYKMALAKGIPMVGICRGAQFLNVMNGGKLIQHADGHTGSHAAYSWYDPENYQIVVTSDHHQLMIPPYGGDIHFEILLWASRTTEAYPEHLADFIWDGAPQEGYDSGEIEVMVFPNTKCLCHQPHPEWATQNSPYRQYFIHTVNELLKL